MPLVDGRFVGPLYRALNPVYARTPLSGKGAQTWGGRFNARGTPALYTALDPATALREANQVGSLQPTILVSYAADVGPVWDARDPDLLARHGLTGDDLSDHAWRMRMLDGRRVPMQDRAAALIAAGYAGLLVRSFAKGLTADHLNVVLWRWTGQDCRLTVIDDEGRLSRI